MARFLLYVNFSFRFVPSSVRGIIRAGETRCRGEGEAIRHTLTMRILAKDPIDPDNHRVAWKKKKENIVIGRIRLGKVRAEVVWKNLFSRNGLRIGVCR